MFSCKPEYRIYEKYIKTSEENAWAKNDTISFHFEIKDTTIKYRINVAVRYVTGFPYTDLLCSGKIITPSGKVMDRFYDFKIRNNKGEYYGEVLGDIGDILIPIDSSFAFHETGTYYYKFTQEMNRNFVPLIMELGMIVNKEKTYIKN